MRTTLATAALIGALGLTGAALITPSVSYAATGRTTAGPAGWVRDALTGLVGDGTLTQAQADEVATTLQSARPEGGRHGRHGARDGGGGRLDLGAAAAALGLTEDELRSRTAAGQTLAEVADAEGVGRSDVVGALVTSAKARLAEAVTAGRLTQAQADERAAVLEERITDRLDRRGPGTRGGAPHEVPGGTEAPDSDTSSGRMRR